MFPPYDISCEDVGLQSTCYLKPYSCNHEQVVEFESVNLEKKISNIIPDIIIRKGNSECLIEIAVTHFIDEEKEEKILNLNLPVLEIDLSHFSHNINKHELAEIIKNKYDNKKWISNPRKLEEHKENAKKYFQEEIKKHNKAQELLRQEREKKEQKERWQKKVFQKIDITFDPDRYEQTIKKLRNDVAAKLEYKKTRMWQSSNQLPFYLDLPIQGEFVFGCDRRIWQMILFEKFIYHRKTKNQIPIDVHSIKKYLVMYFKKNTECNITWTYYEHNILCNIIDKYLKKLHNLGFIEYYESVKWGIVKISHQLTPPDEKYTNLLKQALANVNCFSRDANLQIDEYIDKSIDW